tara:strand:- start:379 stop:846 length:468 start_codon:yes stop_codon:yes gene_type:complete
MKKMIVGLIGVFFSSFLVASDWKELSSGNTGFYMDSKITGSKVILSDIVNGIGIMSVALFTVNSKCTNRGASGEAYIYINKVLVHMNFVCTESGMSLYFAKNEQGKRHTFNEFTKKAEVCYSFKKELQGLCFSAIGFNEVLTKLSDIIVERNNAL